MALAVFGGTTEVVALSFKASGHEPQFYWLLMVMGIAGFGVSLAIRRRIHRLEKVPEGMDVPVIT